MVISTLACLDISVLRTVLNIPQSRSHRVASYTHTTDSFLEMLSRVRNRQQPLRSSIRIEVTVLYANQFHRLTRDLLYKNARLGGRPSAFTLRTERLQSSGIYYSRRKLLLVAGNFDRWIPNNKRTKEGAFWCIFCFGCTEDSDAQMFPLRHTCHCLSQHGLPSGTGAKPDDFFWWFIRHSADRVNRSCWWSKKLMDACLWLTMPRKGKKKNWCVKIVPTLS